MERIPSTSPPTATKDDLKKKTQTQTPQKWFVFKMALNPTSGELNRVPSGFNCSEFLKQESNELSLKTRMPYESAVYDSSTPGSSVSTLLTSAGKRISKKGFRLASDSTADKTVLSNSLGSLSNTRVTAESIPSNSPSTSGEDDLTKKVRTRVPDLTTGKTLTRKNLPKRNPNWVMVKSPADFTLVEELTDPIPVPLNSTEVIISTKIPIEKAADDSSIADSSTSPSLTSVEKRIPEKGSKLASEGVVNETVSSNSRLEGLLSNIQVTPDLRRAKKRKFPRHFDDFTEEHIQTPEGAMLALKMGKKKMAKLQQKLDVLKMKNSALKEQVQALELGGLRKELEACKQDLKNQEEMIQNLAYCYRNCTCGKKADSL